MERHTIYVDKTLREKKTTPSKYRAGLITRQKFLDTMILSNWSVKFTGLCVLLLSLSALSSVRLFEDCPEGIKT